MAKGEDTFLAGPDIPVRQHTTGIPCYLLFWTDSLEGHVFPYAAAPRNMSIYVTFEAKVTPMYITMMQPLLQHAFDN